MSFFIPVVIKKACQHTQLAKPERLKLTTEKRPGDVQVGLIIVTSHIEQVSKAYSLIVSVINISNRLYAKERH